MQGILCWPITDSDSRQPLCLPITQLRYKKLPRSGPRILLLILRCNKSSRQDSLPGDNPLPAPIHCNGTGINRCHRRGNGNTGQAEIAIIEGSHIDLFRSFFDHHILQLTAIKSKAFYRLETDGRSTFHSTSHFAKAPSPIVTTPSGMATDRRLSQSTNA